jgi:hypothetical protein
MKRQKTHYKSKIASWNVQIDWLLMHPGNQAIAIGRDLKTKLVVGFAVGPKDVVIGKCMLEIWQRRQPNPPPSSK